MVSSIVLPILSLSSPNLSLNGKALLFLSHSSSHLDLGSGSYLSSVWTMKKETTKDIEFGRSHSPSFWRLSHKTLFLRENRNLAQYHTSFAWQGAAHANHCVRKADSKAFLRENVTALMAGSRCEPLNPAMEKEWKHKTHSTNISRREIFRVFKSHLMNPILFLSQWCFSFRKIWDNNNTLQ